MNGNKFNFDCNLFKERVKKISNGATQKQVAEILGRSEAQVSRMYNSYNAPSITDLTLIATNYNCSIDYLLGLSDNPRTDKQQKKAITSPKETLADFEKLAFLLCQDEDFNISLDENTAGIYFKNQHIQQFLKEWNAAKIANQEVSVLDFEKLFINECMSGNSEIVDRLQKYGYRTKSEIANETFEMLDDVARQHARDYERGYARSTYDFGVSPDEVNIMVEVMSHSSKAQEANALEEFYIDYSNEFRNTPFSIPDDDGFVNIPDEPPFE